MWLKLEKNKEFKYNIKNSININIKVIYLKKKIFPTTPPRI